MIKQVIVIRRDLNMRKGKMVVQGAHAAIQALLSPKVTEVIKDEWEESMTKKVCVSVDSQSELISLYNQALAMGLPCALITDAGLTEFDGPTITCCAIGPFDAEKIDVLTGKLKLL